MEGFDGEKLDASFLCCFSFFLDLVFYESEAKNTYSLMLMLMLMLFFSRRISSRFTWLASYVVASFIYHGLFCLSLSLFLFFF